jgi:Ca2+-binding EF-hand superfamily protein
MSFGEFQVEALVERDTETMNMKITTTKSRQVLGFCAICTAVALVSVSANAQNVELDLELLNEAFAAADTSGDGRIDEAELSADTVAAFVAVDSNGDDRLSAEELREAGVASIGALDVDKNESLTIIEVMNAKVGEFQNADANGDGKLTIEETRQYERQR